jgi:ankyrin repeat protein
LIERGAKLEDSTALHCTADSSNEDAERTPMIQHLLEIGLDINGTDDALGFRAQGTLLHWAVDACKIERAKFLLEKGANPHKSESWQSLPVQMIARPGVTKETWKGFVELFQRWS